jgi:ubiquinone/menaquinone biosynthesis C-methylase UbiE
MNTAIGNIAPARDAWTAFWADSAQSHCVAGAPGIQRALSAHWSSFATSLHPGCRVLDLGCGAGVVGSWMLRARPDLHVTGIDMASIQRKLHPKLELLADTPMEDLPFTDQRFGAVVSQFGFEYSRRGAAAREIARVLKSAGAMSLLVHHSASPVLVSNRARVAVLDAFLSTKMRAAFCGGDAEALGALLCTLLAQYDGDELLAELARSLPPRLGLAAENRSAIWAAVEGALAPEHCMAHALADSCVSELQLDEWLEPLREVCALMAVSVLREPNGNPLAWRIEASRASARN